MLLAKAALVISGSFQDALKPSMLSAVVSQYNRSGACCCTVKTIDVVLGEKLRTQAFEPS